MRNSWLGLRPRQLSRDRNLELKIWLLIRVQLAAGRPRNAMFSKFFRSFGRNFRCKRVIKFLRWLKEAHLQFLDFKNLKILKWRIRAYTTANLPRTVRYVQLCLRVKFNNAKENYWKPLFALISVRILLKQLDYSLSISISLFIFQWSL